MTNYQLHRQAEREWKGSLDLRRRYPTFDFYWHEQYERIYDIPTRQKVLGKLLKVIH